MTLTLRRFWLDQHGSSSIQAAAAALAAAILAVALIGSATAIVPEVSRLFQCAAAYATGGSCSAQTAPASPASDSADKPWWERLGDALGDAWNWLYEHILTPVGHFFRDAWNWLWQEREATWWKDFLGWLRDKGVIGYGAAAVLGFAMDFLFGLGSDGKFSWGGVIVSTALTVAAFFTAGLAKLPSVARMLARGGRLLTWLKNSRAVQWLAGTAFGQWLAKLGPGGLGDLLDGKLGTILKQVLPRLETRFPWLKNVLDKVILGVPVRSLLEPVGNYLWKLAKEGPFGIAKDVAQELIKRFGPSWLKERLERLGKWKEWQGIFDKLRDPKLPWPFN